MIKLDREQLKHVLRTPPSKWGAGGFDIQIRHLCYMQTADEIDKLEAALQSAKTAALLEVAQYMAARGDWNLAAEIIAYRAPERIKDPIPPVLPVDSIID